MAGNILLLAKKKKLFFETARSISKSDYIQNDTFFKGYYSAFESMGGDTFVHDRTSFLLPDIIEGDNNVIRRIINRTLRITLLRAFDKFCLTLYLAIFCRVKKVDILFSEVNNYLDPVVFKLLNHKTYLCQWFGIYPWMTNLSHRKNLSYYDLVLQPYDLKNQECISWKYTYMPCAVSKEFFLNSNDHTPKKIDILFYGNLTKHHTSRLAILEEIVNKFENIEIYAPFLPEATSTLLKSRYRGPLTNKNLVHAIAQSKICVNLTLDDYDLLERGINARALEVSASGSCLLLMREDKKIQDFFALNKEIVCFDSTEDLIRKINFYLSNDELRLRVARRAQDVARKYTYYANASRLMELLSNESTSSK